MQTRKQHFVSRVYMKAWETDIETSKEPNKKFKGVYVFNNSELLRTDFKQPVYGKLGYSIIKTKKSIEKHFFEINDGDFYYAL